MARDADGWQRFAALVSASLPSTADASPARPLAGVWFCLAALAAMLVGVGAAARPNVPLARCVTLFAAAWALCVGATSIGLMQDPVVRAGPGLFPWFVAGGLACFAASVRARQWSDACHAWEQGRAASLSVPPEVCELPRELQEVVLQARRIRVALDPVDGVDRDAAQLLYEWTGLVRDCGRSERHILGELGLDVGPVIAIARHDRRQHEAVVFSVDAELARFEDALCRYRRRGFR
ncbi:MAG: hypothetical protein AAF721_29905 [Myxococcota bacterium]